MVYFAANALVPVTAIRFVYFPFDTNGHLANALCIPWGADIIARDIKDAAGSEARIWEGARLDFGH
jgi:hypothetical protein